LCGADIIPEVYRRPDLRIAFPIIVEQIHDWNGISETSKRHLASEALGLSTSPA
jgi:hypothetical protein